MSFITLKVDGSMVIIDKQDQDAQTKRDGVKLSEGPILQELADIDFGWARAAHACSLRVHFGGLAALMRLASLTNSLTAPVRGSERPA